MDVGLDREPPLTADDLDWLYKFGYRCFGADAAKSAAANTPFLIIRRAAKDMHGVGFHGSNEWVREDLYRWSWIPTVRRQSSMNFDRLDMEAPLQLSLSSWNSGALRQGELSEAYRGGGTHLCVCQEFGGHEEQDADRQVALLELHGWRVCVGHGGSQAALVRTHLASDITCVFSKQSSFLEATMYQIVLRRPVLGLSTLHVVSLHLNNRKASSTTVAMQDEIVQLLTELRSVANPDFIGADYNRGLAALRIALERDHQMCGSPAIPPLICHSVASDCAGACLPALSKLWGASPLDGGVELRSARTHCFYNPDLGWRLSDAASHYMAILNLRGKVKSGARRRTPATAAARVARKNAARKARKAAASGTSPEVPKAAPVAAAVGAAAAGVAWPPRRITRAQRPKGPRVQNPTEEVGENRPWGGGWETQEWWDWRWREIPPPDHPAGRRVPLPPPSKRRRGNPPAV